MDNNMEQNVEQNELKDIINAKEDGFGFDLKSARKGENLSIKDISNELHLDEKIILALENEDYTQLPEPAFVFGYIRIYAKLLHIQAEPLIEYYKKDYGQEHFEPELKLSKERRIRKPAQNFKMVMPVLMFLFFALLVTGGWQLWLYVSENYINVEDSTAGEELLINPSETNSSFNNTIDDSGELSLPTLYETNDNESKNRDEQGSGAIDNASEPENTVSAAAPSLNEDAAVSIEKSISTTEDSLNELNSQLTEILPENNSQTAGLSTETGDSLNVNVEDSISTNVEDSISTNVEDSIKVEDSPNSAERLSSSAETNAAPVVVLDNQLVLEFAADSWIKIKDSLNKTLAFGVKKSGSNLSLAGQRPYTLIVGNADSVKISLGGRTFDHSSFINENSVARFTIK